MKNLRQEKWGKRTVFVVRDNGNLVHWINKKGSGLDLKSALSHYKRNGTFSKEYSEQRVKLKNVIEITRTYKKSKFPTKIPKNLSGKREIQLFTGTRSISDDGLYSRSNKRVDMGVERNYNKMLSESQNGFFKRISQYFNPSGYDANEGMELVRSNNIMVENGFIWYQQKGKRYSVHQNKKYYRAR